MDTTKIMRLIDDYRQALDINSRPKRYYCLENKNKTHSENLKKCKSCKHCKKENYRAHCSERGVTVDLLQPACERYSKKKK